MRRLLFGLSAAFCGITIAACGDESDNNSAPPPGSIPDASGTKDGESPEGDGGPTDEDADAGSPSATTTRFVLLGDFGFDDDNELAVASLVKSWDPEFIVTLGDNSYPDSTPQTIDETIGKYYSEFIYPYKGKYGKGATSQQRFYACLGNHDWEAGNVKAHTDYFELPNNERYWDVVKGPVHFFCADSDTREPDGTSSTSIQGKWIQKQLADAKGDPHRIVVFHHPSFSSGDHGSQTYMQWPFRDWGASAVYTGHDHDYERFDFGQGTIPYVVQGTGGADLRPMSTSRAGSVFSYSDKHGATYAEANEHYVDFAAITIALDRIDEHVIASRAEELRVTETFLPSGSTLRYLDDSSEPPSDWSNEAFDANAWKSGAAPLGYGQGNEATVVTKGLTHYFRAKFEVVDPNAYDHAVVWLKRDDGAAVYINGKEQSRSNVPKGVLSSKTLAVQTVGFAAEGVWVPTVVPSSALHAGTNVVAVELHQASATSSDALLDVRVEGKKK